MNSADIDAILLTLKLASATTIILIILGVPLAWFLRSGKSRKSKIMRSILSLPLVLPPTVLGFYLLMLMGPNGPLGKIMLNAGLSLWPFTFKGLVFASVIYSIPFVVQPLQNAFEGLGQRSLEVAATLGASPLDAFFTVVIPQSKRAIITAAVLGFAHTVGEFGVVLMIGGNIPGVTQVISMQIFGYVEAMQYEKAHILSAGMLAFSFIIMLTLQLLNSKKDKYAD